MLHSKNTLNRYLIMSILFWKQNITFNLTSVPVCDEKKAVIYENWKWFNCVLYKTIENFRQYFYLVVLSVLMFLQVNLHGEVYVVHFVVPQEHSYHWMYQVCNTRFYLPSKFNFRRFARFSQFFIPFAQCFL